MHKIDRRLYLTADRDRLVEEGDTDAAFLWAAKGDEVTDADAEKVGYVPKGREAATKARTAANKANKAATK